jgi:hypothetical protein
LRRSELGKERKGVKEMKVKIVVRVLLFASILAFGQTAHPVLGEDLPRSSYDPGASGNAKKQQQSGVAAALKKINPQDKDYGAVIEQGRIAVFEQTTEDFYWWSCMVLTALLLLSVVYIAWLWRERGIRLSVSGDIVAQVYNSYVAARAKALEAIEAHNRLARRYNAQSLELVAVREASTAKETAQGSKDGIEEAEKLRSRRRKTAAEPVAEGPASPSSDSIPGSPELQEVSAGEIAGDDVCQLQERIRQLTAQNKAGEQKIANLRTQLGRAHHSLEDLRGSAPTGRPS